MKITIKHICTGLSLCACTCLVNNLPAQAETTNTAAVSATETGWDRQSIMEVARRVADWQIKDYPENKYATSPDLLAALQGNPGQPTPFFASVATLAVLALPL